MTQQTQPIYYDLYLTGIGYLNRAREVPVQEGEPWLAVDLVALQGQSDNVRKTRFDCKVVGKEAQAWVRRLMPRITVGQSVLVGFRLSDLAPETFVYSKGERQGQIGICLKARLLKIAWVKVDGKTLEQSTSSTEQRRAEGASA